MNLHGNVTGDAVQDLNLRIKKEELLMKLLLNELVELLTPIMFVISFIVAYYGPNATIIGNVKNNYWQYGKIENISNYVVIVLIVTVIDLCVGLWSISFITILCKINVYQFFMNKIGKLIKGGFTCG